jgi:glycogenin
MTVQKHVTGEATDMYYGFSEAERIAPPPVTEVAPQIVPSISVEPPPTAVEVPFTEPGEEAENLEQGVTEPVPTIEQRKFSAPQMEWDATQYVKWTYLLPATNRDSI